MHDTNHLRELHEAGQSIWLDFLRRDLITGGGLARLISDDGVTGVTSNPTIFAKAINGSSDYDDAIDRIASRGTASPLDVFYELALTDIRMAADLFAPVYEQTDGADGFVSFELEPRLAHDVRQSIVAAQDLVERIGRPNVMIKIPATTEGIEIVQELTAAGINVNITLLFSVDMYWKMALAYRAGLERRLADGLSLDHVTSVASFFVSRIDTVVDPLLPEGSPLQGRVAIANAKRAYQYFEHLFSGDGWARLAQAGARVQRPLWASTGTKNPAYSDVLYIEELVGRDTVNTVPQATLDAFRAHGRVRPGVVGENGPETTAILSLLAKQGIDLEVVARHLLEDGLTAFDADLAKVVATIESKLEGIPPAR